MRVFAAETRGLRPELDDAAPNGAELPCDRASGPSPTKYAMFTIGSAIGIPWDRTPGFLLRECPSHTEPSAIED
jgi:hypothetical protein